MHRALLITLAGALAFGQAQAADTASYSCKRYKSKCKGVACLKLVDKLQADKERKILGAVQVEEAVYAIAPSEAVQTVAAPMADPDAQTPPPPSRVVYDRAAPYEGGWLMENRTPTGQTREQARIASDGFYTYYLIHTDGSIKDVPVGAPYVTYFGWCDKQGSGKEVTPAAPVQ